MVDSMLPPLPPQPDDDEVDEIDEMIIPKVVQELLLDNDEDLYT
jgi:hypothetical protein